MNLKNLFDSWLLLNKPVFRALPPLAWLVSRYLLAEKLPLDQLQFETHYPNSYALNSERNSERFVRINRQLGKYIGATETSPKKLWEYPWVLANLRLEAGMAVLDAGCGTSPLQFLMSQIGCRVTGLDPNEDVEWHGIQRKLARRFGCPIEYRLESMEAIGFPDDTFDRVCCVSVIEHCHVTPLEGEPPEKKWERDRELHRKMMGEMVRVLKPGGLLALTTDYYLPTDVFPAEENIDVANLLTMPHTEPVGPRGAEPFPGEADFDWPRLIHNSDILFENYSGALQTSIGFTLRKTISLK